MERGEIEELRKRNGELEKQVREFKDREELLKVELERTCLRLRTVEEAEERLCFEMGELEAEAVAQARAYQLHVKMLSDRLGLLKSV
ncbi:hypothetical protein LUZ60_014750 [Juncus effusus]|nr:hypothetical protein LUZ60_014749 [Juncus effusus]KAJ3682177.1 hypothetical protein LUZ60_014750 [Juncus effusus]